MTSDLPLREHVLDLLCGEGAHPNFEKAVDSIPARDRGAAAPGIPHTLWQLLEHLRICQWDILEYCRTPGTVSPKFPDGYWPKTASPPDDAAWDESVAAVRADLKSMSDLVADRSMDLMAPLPHAPEHTLLREALLVADHNSYHVGQMVQLRRALGCW